MREKLRKVSTYKKISLEQNVQKKKVFKDFSDPQELLLNRHIRESSGLLTNSLAHFQQIMIIPYCFHKNLELFKGKLGKLIQCIVS